MSGERQSEEPPSSNYFFSRCSTAESRHEPHLAGLCQRVSQAELADSAIHDHRDIRAQPIAFAQAILDTGVMVFQVFDCLTHCFPRHGCFTHTPCQVAQQWQEIYDGQGDLSVIPVLSPTVLRGCGRGT